MFQRSTSMRFIMAILSLGFFVSGCAGPGTMAPKHAVPPEVAKSPPPEAEANKGLPKARRPESCPERTRRRLKTARARYRNYCGVDLAVSLDWKGLGEGCGTSCVGLVDHLAQHSMGHRGIKKTVRRIKALRCTFGEPASLSHKAGVLTLHLPADSADSSQGAWVEEELLKVELAPKLTFGEAASRELARVCLDGKKVMVMAGRYGSHRGLSTGEGNALVHVGNYRRLSDDNFYDPRFWAPHALTYRRIDMRPVSTLMIDEKKQSCHLVCGTKRKELKLADASTTQRILEKATYRPRPDVRAPHALARDKRGIYYYVDRSSLKGKTKDYRVYVGKRGKLRRQKMIDVVADSQGEIFATKGGKLRFWVGKSEALWIVRRRKKKLTRVPVADNLQLIYKELGVYWGKKLYTPCDDF